MHRVRTLNVARSYKHGLALYNTDVKIAAEKKLKCYCKNKESL